MSTHDINGWIVDTKNALYGPFGSAALAGAFLQDFYRDVEGPITIKPVVGPAGRAGRPLTLEQRLMVAERARELKEGWSD